MMMQEHPARKEGWCGGCQENHSKVGGVLISFEKIWFVCLWCKDWRLCHFDNSPAGKKWHVILIILRQEKKWYLYRIYLVLWIFEIFGGPSRLQILVWLLYSLSQIMTVTSHSLNTITIASISLIVTIIIILATDFFPQFLFWWLPFAVAVAGSFKHSFSRRPGQTMNNFEARSEQHSGQESSEFSYKSRQLEHQLIYI